jgi:hypothetical protein
LLFHLPIHDDVSGTHDRYAIWEKIAEGIGNLQGLVDISIQNEEFVNGADGI